MIRTRLLLLLIAVASLALNAMAGGTGSIRCGADDSYVYLYQTADNFQVLANLKCGQKVEVVNAQSGAMVRVRTSDGKEGYISKSELTALVSTAPETTPSFAAQVAEPQPATAQAPTPKATPQAAALQAAPARGAAPQAVGSQVAMPKPLPQASRPPLTDRELLALVAGNALSENVVREIGSRGLAFQPSDQYRSLLQTAGADTAMMAAVGNAKIAGSAQGAANVRNQLLQHLATAGKLIRSKQYEDASRELSAALESGDGYEAGFVMGESLRQQERWLEAAAVYEEVLRRAPDFLDARTKWSFVLYRGGDAGDALQQAKIVLAQDPENAEAHKNAGLALQVLQKFDASEQEYAEALRIKPDYAVVRYDLGILFYHQGKWDQAIEQYRKSLALDPNEPDWHYNLGLAYQDKGNLDSAIREYREAKRLNPKMFAARMNLGSALMQRGMYAEAVAE